MSDARPYEELATSTIGELAQRLDGGELDARELAARFLARIEALDAGGPGLHAVLQVAPDWEEQADTLDRERSERRPRGLLHGMPILLKDNLDTRAPLATTAGSLALVGPPAPEDAPAVARLREAGALVLGKTNLSEFANWRSPHSISGWSGVGGQTHNPHVLDRTPSGSSSGSGVAVAAALAAVAIGTETDGSIVSPANANGVCGLKPTVGAVPALGIVPISASQDSAGPMTRCVADLGLVGGVLAGRPEWAEAARRPEVLRGARLGVVRKGLCGRNQHTDRLFEDALRALRDAGAVLVDPVELPTADELEALRPEPLVFAHEMKAGLATYLARRSGLGVRTVEDVIRFNREHAKEELRWFGQERLEASAEAGSLDDPTYLETRERGRRLAGPEGIDRILREHDVTALVAPTGSPAHVIDPANSERGFGASTLPAIAGYPILSVPMGLALGVLPVGLAFFAGAGSEATLLGLAAGFEREASHFRVPAYRPTLGLP
ncbi:MAG: amidase [Candidatus Dormibacteraeota bacterium]|nr:amidase [Candidatus Dormibacteraeota bacterium]